MAIKIFSNLGRNCSPNLQLRVARVLANKTQLQLGKAANTTPLKISLAERGLYSPPIIEAQKIAKALGVEAEQLFPASFNKVEKK